MHQHNIYISDVVLHADGRVSAQMITCCVWSASLYVFTNTIGNSVWLASYVLSSAGQAVGITGQKQSLSFALGWHHRPVHIYSRCHTSYSRHIKSCSHWLISLPLQMAECLPVLWAEPDSVANHVKACQSLIEQSELPEILLIYVLHIFVYCMLV